MDSNIRLRKSGESSQQRLIVVFSYFSRCCFSWRVGVAFVALAMWPEQLNTLNDWLSD